MDKKFFLVIVVIVFMNGILAQSQPSNMYEIFENPDGTTTIFNKNTDTNDGEYIEFQNNKFRLAVGSYVIIKENKIFELKGRGDLIFHDIELKGISNALIKTNQNGKIIYADFKSSEGGTYEFEIGEDRAVFRVGARGRVYFDGENGLVNGENFEGVAEFTYKQNKVIGSKFSLELDSAGNLKQVKISENGQFIHNDNIFHSRKNFDVYFNNEDITVKEHAISIRRDEQKIYIRGLVDMETVNGLTYTSLSQDSYTEFNEINNFFDIQKGNVELSNGKHTTIIDGGVARLKNENLASQESAESFSYKHLTKDGWEETGIFDEENGNFVLSSYVNGQKEVTSVSFLELNALIKPTQELSEKITQLQAQLQALEENGATTEEKIKIKGELLVAQNIDLVDQGKIDAAIEFTKEFLEDNYESLKGTETEEYLRISYEEMRIKRALDSLELIKKGISEEELDTVDPQIIRSYINSPLYNVQLGESIKTLMAIQAKALHNGNQDLFESATQVLAQGLLGKGDFERAAKEYRHLAAKTSSTFVQSEAYRLTGIAELQKGDIATALQHYAQALEFNPANSKAQEELQQLNKNVLININRALGAERSGLYQELERAAGIEGIPDSRHFLTNPIATIKNIFGKTARIVLTEFGGSELGLILELKGIHYTLDIQQTGIMAYTAILQAGYDLNNFAQATPSKKILMLQHALDSDVLTAEKFARAAEGLELQNADLALLLENGDYSKAFKMNKNVNPDFNFKTGVGYTDHGLLKEKGKFWRDTIVDQINLNNAIFYVPGPEALINVGGKALTLGGWTVHGAKSLLTRSSAGTRVLSTLSKVGEIPGIQSSIVQAGGKLAIVTGSLGAFPDYAPVISLFSGLLGSRNIGQKALLTAKGDLIRIVEGNANEVDDIVRGATKVGENLYEKEGTKFAVGVGDEFNYKNKQSIFMTAYIKMIPLYQKVLVCTTHFSVWFVWTSSMIKNAHPHPKGCGFCISISNIKNNLIY